MFAMVHPGFEMVDLHPQPNYAAVGGNGKVLPGNIQGLVDSEI
jgi:hypothetical protein